MLKQLFKPLDSAILIYLRFFAGTLLSWELINSLFLGDFQEYLAPFHFTYLYFEWLSPWPFWGLVIHYSITILAGFTFAFGIHQRLSAVILFLGYSLLFLMEKSEYINHLYLYCLIAFWLIWMPVIKNKKLALPAWYFYLMIFQISVVYFFAGIAKLDSEWLSGNTIKTMGLEKFQNFYVYGGLLFDLFVVPFLCWRRSRILAFTATIFFHLNNVYHFGLATFPWFALMMTALFFGPSWPRKLTWFDDFFPKTDYRFIRPNRLLVLCLSLYVVLQVLSPLRHHLYPGKVSWTEDGHQFSWRMKLRTKTGRVVYYILDPSIKNMQMIFPQKYLTKKQYREIIGKPDSILEFAHFLKNMFPGLKIYASSFVSLNGQSSREMIKQIDLSLEDRKLGSYDWITDFSK